MSDCESSVVYGRTQPNTDYTEQRQEEPEERIWRAREKLILSEVDHRLGGVA